MGSSQNRYRTLSAVSLYLFFISGFAGLDNDDGDAVALVGSCMLLGVRFSYL